MQGCLNKSFTLAKQPHANLRFRGSKLTSRCYHTSARYEGAGFLDQQEQQVEILYDSFVLLQRQLALVVKEERYTEAANLKQRIELVLDQLPPSKQMLIALEEQLATAKTVDQRASILQSLGQLGDPMALSTLQQYLNDDRLGESVEAAMWNTFLSAPDARSENMLAAGMKAMGHPEQWRSAISIFSDLIRISPDFAEAYNKRATTYYLMCMYDEAIADCRRTLQRNEFHFGAASGLGMCAAAIGDYPLAIEAFALAMRLNPRLKHLQYHIEQLRNLLNAKET